MLVPLMLRQLLLLRLMQARVSAKDVEKGFIAAGSSRGPTIKSWPVLYPSYSTVIPNELGKDFNERVIPSIAAEQAREDRFRVH